MQIKKIYLDLKEATKEQKFGKDVWTLESESFKEPLTLQIEHESKDLEYLEQIKREINQNLEVVQSALEKLADEEDKAELLRQKYENIIKLKDKEIEKLQEELDTIHKKENKVVSVIQKNNELIQHLQWHVEDIEYNENELAKKLARKPRVINDTAFLSGQGESYLGVVGDVIPGDYMIVLKTKLAEKNEYVLNEDDLSMRVEHISESEYTPAYTIKATDAVSKPTATIERTLALIPM